MLCAVSGLKAEAWTGEPIEQDLTITWTDSEDEVRTLVEGTDYELSYANNVGPAPSTNPVTVTITGIGDVGGQRTLRFKITG